MMSERALVEAIFNTALRGTAGETAARRDALWTAATILLADVLRGRDMDRSASSRLCQHVAARDLQRHGAGYCL
jgi:hypothetical protein